MTTARNDGRSERRRTGIVLPLVVAIVGLVALGVAQGVPNRHRIEDDLTARSEAALRRAGLSTVEVDFVGRDGTLRAGSRADADRALAIVRAQEGVRVARAEVAEGPAVGTTSVMISLDAGRAVVSGVVPSDSTERAILDGIRAALGPDAVEDRLNVDTRLDNAPVVGVDEVVRTLGKETRGATIELRDGEITITGTVPSEGVKAAVLVAASRVVGGPGKVRDRTTVAPSSAPTVQQIQAELAATPPITFESGSANLTPEGQANVERVAAILRANGAIRVRVEGHTDTNGAPERNQALSEARAQTVLTALAMLGIAPDRLAAAGFGESRPKVPDTGAANQAVNRRVEFVVLG